MLIEMDSDTMSGEMLRAHQKLVDRLKAYGVVSNHYVLDNTCSAEFKEAIRGSNMTYQLTDTHDHIHNIAENATSKPSRATSSPSHVDQMRISQDICGPGC